MTTIRTRYQKKGGGRIRPAATPVATTNWKSIGDSMSFDWAAEFAARNETSK